MKFWLSVHNMPIDWSTIKQNSSINIDSTNTVLTWATLEFNSKMHINVCSCLRGQTILPNVKQTLEVSLVKPFPDLEQVNIGQYRTREKVKKTHRHNKLIYSLNL